MQEGIDRISGIDRKAAEENQVSNANHDVTRFLDARISHTPILPHRQFLLCLFVAILYALSTPTLFARGRARRQEPRQVRDQD
jgi:hypothetical protein